MQGINRFFNSLCHLVYFGLLRNIFTTDNCLDSSFHTGEILVVILVQSIRFGNGCVNLCVISIFVLQGSKGIFNSLCHCVYLCLLGDVLAMGNGIDGGFHTSEVLVVVLVQFVCPVDGCINLGVVGILVLHGGNGIFDSFCHSIHFALLLKVFTTGHSIHSSFHSGEILVVILVQGIRFGNGCIYTAIVGRAIDFRIVANLRKCFSQQFCHRAVFKFFFCLFTDRTNILGCSTSPKETVCIIDTTATPQLTCKNASGLDCGHSGSLGRKRCPIYIAILNG